ncbi:MAG TPA: phosphoadenosine phosphosulfate reductase family protein [Methanomassiliicoccales archaeon]
MSHFLHGKALFRWCDKCGTLLLGTGCDTCGATGREFEVSLPGDMRPAMGKAAEGVALILRKHFGSSVPTDSKLIFLNKVAGEDRSDEIVVDGRIIGTMRFDVRIKEFAFDLKMDGAQQLLPVAKKGIVTVAKLTGHLKGKKVSGQEIVDIKGEFSEGDPLIVVSGNTLCSAVAKVGSGEAKTAEKAILIRDVGKVEKQPFGKRASRQDFVAANRRFLEGLESKGVSDIKSFVGNRGLPVTLSFSGGKDSLAAYGISKKAKLKITLIFIDTGLEFPETVDYVHNFVAKHNEQLIEASAGNAFWEQVDTFGPPAKDFRWCCKVCKLGPVTTAIEENYPKGTITIEGNRGLESFSRSRMNFVESNPFVPNQTILNPIKDWRAADVWGYIWLRGLDFNPLYEQDFERIGCYLCASCLESEWKRTSELHPKLHSDWQAYLDKWSRRVGVGPDFVRYGLWRWKVLPPKMRQLADEVNLKVPQARSDRLELKMTKGVSPCVTGGYSIEGVLILPKKRDFSRVGETLKTVGKVKLSEEFEIALVKNREGTVKVFGGGQVLATAANESAAQKLFESGVKAILKAQMCTRCNICVKNCPQRAIRIEDSPIIIEERCNQCGRCTDACVVAHYYDKLVAGKDRV